ncbi:MAG: 50S ribosomal protein L29 [Arenicellales bacterium WSBS_2016_MAG_OTU3]
MARSLYSALVSKSESDLKQDLVGLRREQFNLRMQLATGQLANPARFKALRKEIARIKTRLTELAGQVS